MSLPGSLLLSAAGGALTLLGTWVGFQIQVREQRKVRSEQVARENLLRLHAERVTSYAAFYREGGRTRAALSELAQNPDNDAAVIKAREQRGALWHECSVVTLIGSKSAAQSAWALLEYATDVAYGDSVFDRRRFARLIWDFILTARADLLFPDEPGTPLSELWAVAEPSEDEDDPLPERHKIRADAAHVV